MSWLQGGDDCPPEERLHQQVTCYTHTELSAGDWVGGVFP